MQEDNLLAGMARQAAQDVCAVRGVTIQDKFTAWEFLRRLGLDRRQRMTLLEKAEQASQEAQDNGRYSGVQRHFRS